MTTATSSNIALSQFLLENKVNEIFTHNQTEQKQLLDTKPWTSNPNYFTNVKISSVALIKMQTHARSGGSIEVMGLLQGKIENNTFIIMDTFSLPVEGTETRVNAQAEGYEYMVKYSDSSKLVDRPENVVGWYHSHPGYGCWLSGIDVATQALNQQYTEPFLAIVVDPIRSISAGRVEIGAFRTYPEGYTSSAKEDSYQSVPMDKIEDFGVHYSKYYQLEVSYFKSTVDELLLERLFSRYWVNTIASSVSSDSKQVLDLSEKLARGRGEAREDCCKVSHEKLRSYMQEVVKGYLFGKFHGS